MIEPGERSAVSSGDPFIGRQIAGRYLIRRLIARGGMGSVYEAEQLPLGRRVALKILLEPANAGSSNTFEHRFFLEASSLARLSHPHTVTLYDYGQADDGTFYLVMEYVDGWPLSKILQTEGRITPDRTIRLMLQVARAVYNAHRHGIVHRDLKPSNLLVTHNAEGEETIKVVDFGLAKLTEGDQSITVTGMILGSPHCMAPEQVQGGDVDERTDVYAIGVLLFRSLTGQYPFHGSTTTATMIAHIQNPIPQLAQVAPELQVPEGLEAIIRKALAKDPAERYASLGPLIKELGSCASVPQEEFTAVSTIIQPPPASRKVLPLVAIGGLALGMIGVAGYHFATAEPEPHEVAVTITSSPPGATVEVNGEIVGVTPMDLRLASQGETDLRRFDLSLDGYVSTSVERDLAGRDALPIAMTLSPLPNAEPVVPKEKPVESPPKSASDPPKSTPRRTEPEKPRPPQTGTKEGSTTPATTPGEPVPAGYKSNPFD